MRKYGSIRPVAAILFVLLMVGMLIPPMLAAASANAGFIPSPNYTLSDSKATLHTFGYTAPPYPARVDWLDPNGALVAYCASSGCGASYDQQVATNGILVWRDFYFYIAGQGRAPGTYTAIAYFSPADGGMEVFRQSFTISGSPEPPPTPVPVGKLDPEFGTAGIVTTDFSPSSYNGGQALAIQPDGKIVVAGSAYTTSTDFALARYTPNGSLDTGFGSQGIVTTDFGDYEQAYALALQDDGKILAAGHYSYSRSNKNYDAIALARYTASGSLDAAFGTGGKVTTNLIEYDEAAGMAIQDDGKIVVVGWSLNLDRSRGAFAIVRYNANGSLDASFGSGGKVRTEFSNPWWYDGAHAVTIQADGKIVAAGGSNGSFALARYTSKGSLDPSFGTAGTRVIDFGSNGASAVALLKDGSILAAGSENGGFGLAKFTSGGSLDASFGSGGTVITLFGGDDAGGHAIIARDDGKIVVVGSMRPCAGCAYRFALARYTASGSLDTTHGTSGKLTAGESESFGNAGAAQRDGKILVAGNSYGDFILARFILQGFVRSIYLPLAVR